MCTLSIVRTESRLIITSNRDDAPHRAANDIVHSSYGHKDIYYPSDQKAEGTWFCCDSLGDFVILLNGADKKHEKEKHHTLSRGFIPIALLSHSDEIKTAFDQLELYHTQPFTLISMHSGKLCQCSWDGASKEYQDMDDRTQTHLFSSATLFDSNIRKKKKSDFQIFIEEEKTLTADLLWHLFTKYSQDKENGYRIDRSIGVKTLSTTQLIISEKEKTLRFKSHIYDFEKSISI
jgi:uncharacterized protein with NRDE domain